MLHVTRFNPTANGRLHIGHAYMALVNQAVSNQNQAGPFVLRIDDTQEYLFDRLGAEKVAEYSQAIIDDLAWLGIVPDQISYQHEIGERVSKLLADYPIPYQGRVPQFYPDTPACGMEYYSYTPWYTLEKVVMDYLEGVTFLVRGLDLISEFGLYNYYCQQLNLHIPHHIYLPRLTVEGQGELLPVSKSGGGYTLDDFRQRGVAPDALVWRLRRACLIEWEGPWLPYNIRPAPVYDDARWT